MQEKPKVTVSRTRRTDSAAKEFNFAQTDIRAGGDSVASYRASAWDAFKRLSLPSTTDEAWRRTDIHALPADKFTLPKDGAFDNLPTVRADLLKPLIADQHGGQIVLTPGGSTIELSESLTKKGVIFTDLKTAEQKSRLMREVAPLAVLLPSGLAKKIDAADVGRAGFVRCLPNGCVAEVVMDENLIKQLRAGATATFIIFQTPEEGIGFPMALKGFGEGYDKLP